MQQTRCMNCMKEIAPGTRICPHCGYDQQTAQISSVLRPETILHGRYLVGRVIGKGGFGITYVGLDLTLEMRVAIKEYYPSGIATRNNSWSNQVVWDSRNQGLDASAQRVDSMERMLKEARRTAKLSDVPSIVRVHDAFRENETAYLVMDFIEGMTLRDYLVRNGVMSWEECKRILFPVMDGLARAHDMGIIHRDISPDNIMIRPDGTALLLDLGAALDKNANGGHATTFVVKNHFSAREQYDENGEIGSWTDVYAFAALIYYCLTGKQMMPVMDRIMNQQWEPVFPPQPEIPEHVKNALRKALKIEREDRIQDMREFQQALMQETQNTQNTYTPQEEQKPHTGRAVGKQKLLLPLIALLCLVLVVGVVFAVSSVSTNQDKSGGTSGSESANGTAGASSDGSAGQNTGGSGDDSTTSTAKNVLMNDYDAESGDISDYVFGSQYERSEITKIVFQDSLENEGSDSWDMSEAGDGCVKAWVEETGTEEYCLYIAAEGGVTAPEDSGFLFCDYSQLALIDFNGAFFTDNVQNMEGMFCGCESLTELDLGSFDTSQVTNMKTMFAACSSLTDLNLGSFDTSRVTDMESMFVACKSLTELDLSGFDTSQVTGTGMSYMFSNCHSLEKLDISGFDTSQVTDMEYMFFYCPNLSEVDVSGFDTSKVTVMFCMFYCCGSLTELDVSGFDTSQVTDMSSMFYGCSGITELDVSGFDTSQVTTMQEMFGGCEKLTTLDLSGFDVSNVSNEENWSGFLDGCTSLTELLLWDGVSDELEEQLYGQAGLTVKTSEITASQTEVTLNISDIAVTKFEINPSVISIQEGTSISHSVGFSVNNETYPQISFTYTGGTDSSLTVTSSDESVVTVEDITTEGNVTTLRLHGHSTGTFEYWNYQSIRTAEITATANDGSGATCSVIVTVDESISYTITSSNDEIFHFNYNDDGIAESYTVSGTGTVTLTLKTKKENTATTTITVTD